MNINEPTIRFKVVIPRDWTNRQKGKFWEDVSAPLFKQNDWKVDQNIEFDGMQTDIYVTKPEVKKTALIECKFHEDPIDAPTIFKLMGQAIYKRVDEAYLLSISGLNATAKAVVKEYQEEQKPFSLSIWSEDKLAEIFMDIHSIKRPELDESIGRVETITLLITDEKGSFWVAEEIAEGLPCRAIIFTIPNTNTKNNRSPEEWKKYFAIHKIWDNLEVAVFNPTVIKPTDKSTDPLSSEVEKVTVSKINQADSFDDYHRPCRPDDFFGRFDTQKKFWDFVNNVRDGKTELRVVSFSGSTGLGKSSLVLKLASDCRKKPEYKDNFLYHVDVTSVNQKKANLFVIAAIRKALQDAIDSGFVKLPNHPNHQVSIESAEPPYFHSKSIQLLIENFKESGKVIVIFFDQFEEILTKDSLSSLYDLFQQAAFDVDGLKENIVLGFCWRTDVNLPLTHQAYFAWHNLANRRTDIYFSEFSSQDSSNLLDGFDKYLTHQTGKRLQPSIKKWIEANFQNQPWLLKKICGDIYNQHLNQSELRSAQKKVITKLDIKTIFQNDIRRATVTSKCYECLMYVAEFSPVSKIDVCNQFNGDVVNSLLKSKLVIETGQNYKIYWDMFREYLLDGKLPEMIISYKPRTKISTVLKIFRLLNEYEKIPDLVRVSKYEDSTVNNAIYDLQNFFEVTKEKGRKIIASESFLKLTNEELAEKLAEQLEDHEVIKKIYEQRKPGEFMWLAEVQNFLSDEETRKPTTAKDYTSRMLSWFHFAGLLEVRNGRIVRPSYPKQGKQKGKPEDCEPSYEQQPKSNEVPGQLPFFDTSDYQSRYYL